jgi:probable F420-dependent oxidoreductase
MEGAPVKFGVGLPTCTEGLMYPIPFARPEDLPRVAIEAERLGYYEVMGNEHLTTQRYVRESYPIPPSFYDPLITYAYCAARTERIRFMTGVVVMPVHEPVLLAKQVATLDRLSGGRVILGLGVGAYREEFEAVRPVVRQAARGEMVEEGMRGLRLLFAERRASFAGRHYAFQDVEMYPKPLQEPLPIYSAGNADGSIRRAAELCQGWLPAGIGPEQIAQGREKLQRYAGAAGRDPTGIAIALQSVVSIGVTAEAAREAFLRSQLYAHLVSLRRSTLKDVDTSAYEAINLIGTPEEICRRVERLAAAGVSHLCGLLFVGSTVDEMLAQIRLFAQTVIPAFPDRG